MIYNLKGFIKIPALIDNATDVLSPLGEISDDSYTCSRHKGFYSDVKYRNVELVSFTSKDELGDVIEVPGTYADHVLQVSQWAFEQAINGGSSDDVESFRRAILARFPEIEGLEVGAMEVARGSWLPTYLYWSRVNEDLSENHLRIWFANAAFEAQYTDAELIVIPTVAPVDTFQLFRQNVVDAVDAFDLTEHHGTIQLDTNNDPYTLLVSPTYDWVDREDPSFRLPTHWSVAIYGFAGNNPARIKQAIADYILANSAYGKDTWIEIFPDIFTSTEFTFIPQWQNLSTEDETPRGSLYSPLLSYNEIWSVAEKYINYPREGHLAENLTVTGIQFKSITSLVCGGLDNRDGQRTLKEVWPNYALLSTSSMDFNRMPPATAEWAAKLIEAVIAAEEVDEYSYVGAGLSRITRDGRIYVAFEYDNILYLILTRKAMDEVNLPE